MKKITKAAAAKVSASNKASKKVKKVNLAEVGKKKPGRKAKDEDKKKKVNLTEVVAKKRGRKSNAEKAAEQAAIDKAAQKALAKATKLAEKVNGDEPKKRKGSKVSAYDWALANIKKPNDAAARKLQPGDVIEVFYSDAEKPTVEVVIASCERNETIYDVITVMQEKWQAGRVTSLTKVNSDMWRKIGTLAFKIKKD